jgi:hypothetical protein
MPGQGGAKLRHCRSGECPRERGGVNPPHRTSFEDGEVVVPGHFGSQKVPTADYRPLSLLLYNHSVYDLNNS